MVISPHTFELRLNVDAQEYQKWTDRAFKNSKGSHKVIVESYGYEDRAFSEMGVTIEYHNYNESRKNFKRNIRLIVNPSKLLGGDDLNLWKPNNDNIDKLIKRVKICIENYFDSKYKLKNFTLARIDFTVNIDVGGREYVSNYIKILNKLSKVKGYKLKYKKSDEKWYDKDLSFDLAGNSNGVEFTAYDKEAALKKKKKEDESRINKAKGVLRIEVRLVKKKSINKYTNETSAEKQIKDLSKKSEKIFMENFTRIIPYGDFYKKSEAVSIINSKISKSVMRKKMLRLLELVPEKKSLHEAQKAMNDRDMKGIMYEFEKLRLSPVIISKRMKVDRLRCLYDYFVD